MEKHKGVSLGYRVYVQHLSPACIRQMHVGRDEYWDDGREKIRVTVVQIDRRDCTVTMVRPEDVDDWLRRRLP